jgi:heme/copper-type cytochrome/quinol oxidase subunit 2
MTRVQRVLVISIVLATASLGLAAVRLATIGDETTTEAQAPTSPAPAPAPARPAAVVRPVRSYRLTLELGVPKPRPADIRARVGDEIRLTVSSRGAEDDVSIDGLGEREHVAPGAPARIRFVADRPGFFDAYLDESGAKVADIEVVK